MFCHIWWLFVINNAVKNVAVHCFDSRIREKLLIFYVMQSTRQEMSKSGIRKCSRGNVSWKKRKNTNHTQVSSLFREKVTTKWWTKRKMDALGPHSYSLHMLRSLFTIVRLAQTMKIHYFCYIVIYFIDKNHWAFFTYILKPDNLTWHCKRDENWIW